MIDGIIKILKKAKELLRNYKRHSLPYIIGHDLLQFGKLSLFLFICIITTAMMVVITTYYTRLLIVQREQFVIEQNNLDIEWRNLILEENVLSEHSRIEGIATNELQLQHINPFQENIIVQNNNKNESDV